MVRNRFPTSKHTPAHVQWTGRPPADVKYSCAHIHTRTHTRRTNSCQAAEERARQYAEKVEAAEAARMAKVQRKRHLEQELKEDQRKAKLEIERI